MRRGHRRVLLPLAATHTAAESVCCGAQDPPTGSRVQRRAAAHSRRSADVGITPIMMFTSRSISGGCAVVGVWFGMQGEPGPGVGARAFAAPVCCPPLRSGVPRLKGKFTAGSSTRRDRSGWGNALARGPPFMTATRTRCTPRFRAKTMAALAAVPLPEFARSDPHGLRGIRRR
jgi:hypothetical protein